MFSKLFDAVVSRSSRSRSVFKTTRTPRSTTGGNLGFETLEPRSMMTGVWCLTPDPPFRYQPDSDPIVGAVVTAFVAQDPEDASDSYDVLTGWLAAVDELSSIGATEVSFAVYRQVNDGVLSGGPSVETVATAVDYAIQKNLSVTILPVFETESGWRGNYDPIGETRDVFQTGYRQWISDLSKIEGIDRFNIGSELNQMLGNAANEEFFAGLITVAQEGFDSVGNESGRIGYAANHDAFSNESHRTLFSNPNIDFIGISAYRSLTPVDQLDTVAGTGEVSPEVLDAFIENWTRFFDDVEQTAEEFDLPVVIQEVGAVQRNYASAAPFAVEPGNFVPQDAVDRGALDPKEQEAIFKSAIAALDGRGETFESITFWTWEHQASRGPRTTDVLGTDDGFESFAIYPDDGGGGEFLAKYIATETTLASPGNNPVGDLGITDANPEVPNTGVFDTTAAPSGSTTE